VAAAVADITKLAVVAAEVDCVERILILVLHQ
jgi:hypothetical protein